MRLWEGEMGFFFSIRPLIAKRQLVFGMWTRDLLRQRHWTTPWSRDILLVLVLWTHPLVCSWVSVMNLARTVPGVYTHRVLHPSPLVICNAILQLKQSAVAIWTWEHWEWAKGTSPLSPTGEEDVSLKGFYASSVVTYQKSTFLEILGRVYKRNGK